MFPRTVLESWFSRLCFTPFLLHHAANDMMCDDDVNPSG